MLPRNLLKLALIALLVFVIAPSTFGDDKIGMTKGQPLVIKIPRKYFKYENYSLMTGMPIYSTTFSTVSLDKVSVEGVGDWHKTGWPIMATVYFEKGKAGKNGVEIECRSTLGYFKFRSPTNALNINSVLKEIFYWGTADVYEGSSEFKALADQLLARSFTGVLSRIPKEKKMALMKQLSYNDEGMGIETFKGKDYISFSVVDPSSVFNTLRVNQATRTATMLKGSLLPALKLIAPYITETNEIYGIKLRVRIFYKDFLAEQYVAPHADVLEVYSPYNLVEKYYNLDLTDQKLVDGAIILLNGSRVEVDLSQTATI
ncbi:MAG TPA: hypothetical protein PLD20_00875 [Blastocatellia bacterium]|nr:hypothetical protein [Blastocatellia bacterium]HMV81800.1 hypothetical protein [Blastocatellia bacterium]HMX24019.1 hypothetical protein [Blastocatellia bacterium]HMY70699.1 hypothetical protein [Blastocatellia bacterium]HMZ16488.1 hypothetical protein [Blastocatellia bacterium]